jgi:asparagine synthase (glutamine-hydrolysing)
MCGFLGVFRANKSVELSITGVEITQAMDVIKHRGPDDTSTTSSVNYHIGFNRLSINDLSKSAMQPFVLDGVKVFVNGEIYNHKDIENKESIAPASKSDCEVIIHLYLKYGISFIERLNGMFAIVIIDDRSNELHLIQDRFSVKPLYYYIKNDEVIFGSEIKAIKKIAPDIKVDGTSVDLSLTCTDVVAPFTPYVGVRKLFPGQRICLSSKGIKSEIWYRFNGLQHAKKQVFNKNKFYSLFDAAVERRLESDVEIGAFLSGGLDSSLIVTKMRNMLSGDIHVFNAVISDKFTHEPDHDNINAKLLSSEIGLRYHPVEITKDRYIKDIVRYAANHDEMLMDSGDFIFYAMSEEAKGFVTVVLDGMGADEMFAGYPWQKRVKRFSSFLPDRVFYSRRVFDRLNSLNRKAALLYRYFTSKTLSHANSLAMLCHSQIEDYEIAEDRLLESYDLFNADLPKIVTNDNYNYIDALNYLTIIPYQNIKCDRGSMFSSIENRSPFLDYNLVEYMMSIPSSSKGSIGKKKMQRDILKGVVPDYILKSPKSGPTFPLDYWIKSDKFLHHGILNYLKNNSDLFDYVGSGVAEFLHSSLKNNNYNGLSLHTYMSALIWIKQQTQPSDLDLSMSLLDLIRAE